ncbi:hypothetical protein RYX36_023546 [Vicia faba]
MPATTLTLSTLILLQKSVRTKILLSQKTRIKPSIALLSTLRAVRLIPAYATSQVQKDEPVPINKDGLVRALSTSPPFRVDELVPNIKYDPTITSGADKTDTKTENIPAESETVQRLEQLKI